MRSSWTLHHWRDVSEPLPEPSTPGSDSSACWHWDGQCDDALGGRGHAFGSTLESDIDSADTVSANPVLCLDSAWTTSWHEDMEVHGGRLARRCCKGRIKRLLLCICSYGVPRPLFKTTRYNQGRGRKPPAAVSSDDEDGASEAIYGVEAMGRQRCGWSPRSQLPGKARGLPVWPKHAGAPRQPCAQLQGGCCCCPAHLAMRPPQRRRRRQRTNPRRACASKRAWIRRLGGQRCAIEVRNPTAAMR